MNAQECCDRESESERHHASKKVGQVIHHLTQGSMNEKWCWAVQATNKGIEQEVPEVLVIENPDAISHPGAVMIHLPHTCATYGAMMCPRGLDLLAFVTISESDVVSHSWRELPIYGSFHIVPRRFFYFSGGRGSFRILSFMSEISLSGVC